MMDRSPVGEVKVTSWFALGSAVGGATAAFLVLGSMAAAASLLPADIRFGLAILALAVTAAAVLGWITLPRIHRQARQTLGEMVPGLGAFVFGVELGSGLRTYTSSLALYVTLVPALLGVPLTELVLLGTMLGLGRGIVPLDRLIHTNRATWEQRLVAGPRWLRAAPSVSLVLAAAWTVGELRLAGT